MKYLFVRNKPHKDQMLFLIMCYQYRSFLLKRRVFYGDLESVGNDIGLILNQLDISSAD